MLEVKRKAPTGKKLSNGSNNAVSNRHRPRGPSAGPYEAGMHTHPWMRFPDLLVLTAPPAMRLRLRAEGCQWLLSGVVESCRWSFDRGLPSPMQP